MRIERKYLPLSLLTWVLVAGMLLPRFLPAQNGPLDLLPVNQATHTVLNSGNWTDPNTWTGGNVPTNLAKVLIPSGKTLTVDGEVATRIKIIRIQGKLAFVTTANTALKVETIVQDMTGELEIGTPTGPIPQGTTCKITIIDEGDIVLSTAQFEKGLTLMGKTVIHGAAKDSWKRVATNPSLGATNVQLESAPSGWQTGDRIVITGTDAVTVTGDEVATIASISGSTVTFTQPLAKSHDHAPAPDLRVHVANLSRNVVIESENGTSNNGRDRGHVMFMHTLDANVRYLRLHRMGRTRKDVPVDDWYINESDQFVTGPKTNIRGRYSMHFHRGGVSPNLTPARVTGCVVEDDPGWAYANHSAFVHFDNNVSYNVIGGGFQTEAGDELGSFTNNIAIRTVNTAFPLRDAAPANAPDTREGSQDFSFQGDGFWVHGGGVTLTGNVASGSSGHGFIYWPEGLIEPGFPSGTYRNTFVPANLGLPNSINIIPEEDVVATGWVAIAGFQDNETYASTIGLATFYLHTTFFNDKSDYDPNYIAGVHSTFENFSAWNVFQDGVQLNFTEKVTFKNLRLANNDGNSATVGVSAGHYRAKEKQIFDNVDVRGFGTGLTLPPSGQVTVNCGNLSNGINLKIPAPTKSPRDLRIEGLTTAADPAFSNPVEIQLEAVFDDPDDRYPAYFLLPDRIILNYGNFSNQRLYYDQQAAGFIPLPSDASPYTFIGTERVILAEFAAKSNQQLQSDYQMSFGGSLLPGSAVSTPGIVGGKIAPWQSTSLNVPICVDQFGDGNRDGMNNCLAASNNKVAGPLPNYVHPTSSCTTNRPEETLASEDRVVLYPNPTTGIFTLEAQPGQYRIEVFDLNGGRIRWVPQANQRTEINLSRFPTGIYFVRLHNTKNGGVSTKKVVKLN
ncbi:MAG: G8 domain-containing protein [Bacteroidota bacterium]